MNNLEKVRREVGLLERLCLAETLTESVDRTVLRDGVHERRGGDPTVNFRICKKFRIRLQCVLKRMEV